MLKRYSPDEISRIRRLRQKYKPCEIAKMVGRTEGAIDRLLSLEKKKGAEYPKLKHGSLKYDKDKAAAWRDKVRAGMRYDDLEPGIDRATIWRVLASEARGELEW